MPDTPRWLTPRESPPALRLVQARELAGRRIVVRRSEAPSTPIEGARENTGASVAHFGVPLASTNVIDASRVRRRTTIVWRRAREPGKGGKDASRAFARCAIGAGRHDGCGLSQQPVSGTRPERLRTRTAGVQPAARRTIDGTRAGVGGPGPGVIPPMGGSGMGMAAMAGMGGMMAGGGAVMQAGLRRRRLRSRLRLRRRHGIVRRRHLADRLPG